MAESAPKGGDSKEVGVRFLPAIREGLTATHGQLQALADFWTLLCIAARSREWDAIRPVLEDFDRKNGMGDWLFRGPPVREDCVAEPVCPFSLEAECNGDHSEHCSAGETACKDPECQACSTGSCREEHAKKSAPPTCPSCKQDMEDDECPECGDCSECCWENHGGEPHAPGGG
jgi:hypothetical protein